MCGNFRGSTLLGVLHDECSGSQGKRPYPSFLPSETLAYIFEEDIKNRLVCRILQSVFNCLIKSFTT